MNVISRGIKNALRSPLRAGVIIILLAVSIGLILCMLVARSSVTAKISTVKATSNTSITINPAGIQGGFGEGNPLTAAQVATIQKTPHVASIVATLQDQMGTSDTNLTPSQELGSFGARQDRFTSSGSDSTATGGTDSTDSTTQRFTPTARITVTGTNDPTSTVTTSEITSGKAFDGSSTSDVALVGKTLASKNNLSVGSTFTGYSQTITVAGIFSSGNTFEDNGIIMPLATVQTLTDQSGAVSAVTATADSSDNVASVVSSLKSSLGSAGDITSEADRAAAAVAPLESIANLALGGVIAAAGSGAIIILLAMIVIVRERKREIGVIKAIGGTNGKVIAQFMTEGLTLTIIGAIIGFGFGILAAGPLTSSLVQSQSSSTSTTTSTTPGAGGRGGFAGRFGGAVGGSFKAVGSSFTTVTASLTPQSFGLAIGITVLIALVGTGLPAWFIARIRPAEVLRTE